MIIRTTLIAILFLFEKSVFAWGPTAHKIIVQIAKSQLDKSVSDMVGYYLKGASWDAAACELDEEKHIKSNDKKKNWHYAWLEKDKTYVAAKDPNAINQIEFNIRVLQNRSLFGNDMVCDAIKNLLHLVGDVSNPLHCGYPNDKGGMDIAVKFKDKATTLHEVWDNLLIEELKVDIWECTKIVLKMTDKEKAELKKLDFTAWANDSRSLLPSVYDFKDQTISQTYIDQRAMLVKTQLAKAGIRLAAVLNNFFKE